LDFIEKYHYRICAVIVNPMLHFTGINHHSIHQVKSSPWANENDKPSRNKTMPSGGMPSEPNEITVPNIFRK
jgi:hypothetical protein